MAGESILIVDDNAVNLKLVRVLLAKQGYETQTAGDAEQALAILETFHPRLILIEAKGTTRSNPDHLRGLREIAIDHKRLGRRILVSMEDRARRTEDGIDILPAKTFARRLWDGELV